MYAIWWIKSENKLSTSGKKHWGALLGKFTITDTCRARIFIDLPSLQPRQSLRDSYYAVWRIISEKNCGIYIAKTIFGRENFKELTILASERDVRHAPADYILARAT